MAFYYMARVFTSQEKLGDILRRYSRDFSVIPPIDDAQKYGLVLDEDNDPVGIMAIRKDFQTQEYNTGVGVFGGNPDKVLKYADDFLRVLCVETLDASDSFRKFIEEMGSVIEVMRQGPFTNEESVEIADSRLRFHKSTYFLWS